jgi:hypothetical protein
MLPVLILGGIGILTVAEGFGYACWGGMTYAFGRKVGRNVCVFMDGMEGRARSVISSNLSKMDE